MMYVHWVLSVYLTLIPNPITSETDVYVRLKITLRFTSMVNMVDIVLTNLVLPSRYLLKGVLNVFTNHTGALTEFLGVRP